MYLYDSRLLGADLFRGTFSRNRLCASRKRSSYGVFGYVWYGISFV